MEKRINIEGMSCNHCVNHVKEALEDININVLEVNLDEKYALVNTTIENETIIEAIDEAGYTVISII